MDNSVLITPKSALSQRDNSGERCGFFKFKRQLHKSNLCNISNELANSERFLTQENFAKDEDPKEIKLPSNFGDTRYEFTLALEFNTNA
jgi:hypothetical protein